MNFRAFQALAGSLPYFDLPMALQWTGQERHSLVVQLGRWTRAGYLIALRRGLHTLAEPFRKTPISAPELANVIYSPAYLSLEWALGQYGLIPEAVPVLTSVTSRATRTFENSLGRFEYRSIQPGLFAGFVRRELLGSNLYIADPEKAILDFFYFSEGEWSSERHEEMRWQNLNLLRSTKLKEMVDLFPNRVQRAMQGLEKHKAREKGIRL